ncbi:hypothetical protein HELRODRAFT_166734 [Helobdella robusta]|uniref:Uncharacterized protein n=1 Tax=Helobdella robusta TaxID=6412 RepID=T1EYG1_HELRO|nr:hypothetical protein HELRODRAFT_166734 [Helobdella robusta]ESO11716.1 hypothetical protein HELRODRAFT_166734 [Helobdella robusta]
MANYCVPNRFTKFIKERMADRVKFQDNSMVRAFADNLALAQQKGKMKKIVATMQQEIDVVVEWSKKNKTKSSTIRSDTILFDPKTSFVTKDDWGVYEILIRVSSEPPNIKRQILKSFTEQFHK